MRTKCSNLIVTLVLSLALVGCNSARKSLSGFSSKDVAEYMTIEEAMAALKTSVAAAPLAPDPGNSPELSANYRPPFTLIQPVRLFDNLFFVGTTAVGAFIADAGDGLVMFDTGCGDADVALMVESMKKLGLDPSRIRLIFISHEHFDHYGGVQYLKKNVCPDAKVAMSLTGWNMLQTVPYEWAYIGTRPQSVDIYLTDGMKIKVGESVFQIVATPGHSAGCVSFIIPATDNGEVHMAGIMGGSAVWPTQAETRLYQASVEYFKAFAMEAGCDVGLYFHSGEQNFASLRIRKPHEPNPLVIGTEKFDTEYLQSFRNRYIQMLNSGNIKSY